MKRFLSTALALALSFSLALPAGAAEADNSYSDIPGHWAETAVQRWSGRGVVQGAEGAFRPDDSLTRAELAVILDRVMGYQEMAQNSFSDLDESWYTQSILKLASAGVLEGAQGRVSPNALVTRQEAAVMLARAFQVEEEEEALPFSDKADVADWATGAVSALSGAGYIQGYQNCFDPQGSITRASLVTILDNMISDVVTQAGDYSQDAEGSLVVAAADAVLKDLTVKGDLIIADAVGDGDVTLENVQVDGRLIIRGGGEHSIHIAGDASQYGTIIVTKTASGKVRLVNESGAPIPMVNVADGRDGVTLEGSFTDVVIASDVAVMADGGKMASLTITVPGADVTLGESSEVTKLDIHQDAAGSALSVAGKVGELSTAAGESKIAISGEVKKVFAAETATDSAISVDKGGKVTETLSVKAAVAVDNAGTIKKAEVGASGVTMDGKKPASVSVEKGVDKPTDSKGNTVKDTSSSNSGSSSTPSTTTLSAVAATLASPQAGKTATAATPAGAGYTVTTTWVPALEEEKFAKDTAYTATLTFTPAAYYKWSDAILEHVTVNNSTSYGDTATLGEPALADGKVTVTAEYPATAAELAIVVDTQPAPDLSVSAGSSNSTVQVTAHVEADGVAAPNYPITYEWRDDQNQPMPNSGTAIFHLPAGLAEGIYTYHCHMTAEGCEAVDSENVVVTVGPAPEGLVISNVRFVQANSDTSFLDLKWDLEDGDGASLDPKEFSFHARYYSSGVDVLGQAMNANVPLDFVFYRHNFTTPSLVIDKIEITPIQKNENNENVPIGATYTMTCNLTLTRHDFPGSASALYDATTNKLTLSGYSQEGISYYCFQIYENEKTSFGVGRAHLTPENTLVDDTISPSQQEVLQAAGTKALLAETKASLTDGTTAAIAIYQSELVPITLQQSGNE